MHADAETLSVTFSFADRSDAVRFFLRLLGRAYAAQAALAMLDRGEAPDWAAANDAALEAHRTSSPDAGTFRLPELFRAGGSGLIFGGGRSELRLCGVEVTIGPRAGGPHIAPAEIADAIAGRMLGGRAPWQQTPERAALARKILALWAKDKKEREAAAEEERRASRSGLTVAEYRARAAKAARRSGRAGSGGKRNWTARRAVAA